MSANVVAPSANDSRRWVWAVGLSVIPGLGQVFNRQIARGAVLFIGAAGSITASVLLLSWGIGTGPTVFNRYGLFFLLLALATIFVFLAGLIFGLYVWASAVVDAYSCSRARERGDMAEAQLWHRFKL